MSKLYRSLLWSGLVLAGVAACGDDVTVTPNITVSVAPTGVSISVGQTVQMTAAVNAPAGTATTVTWSSSDASKASVSATGLVTGVAAGSVAITACSTVNTSACGSATITVGAVAPVVISIDGFTYVACVGCPEASVPLNNVTGQIQAHLSLDPGGQNVSSVDLLVDGVVAGSQGFSLVQWQEVVAQAQAAAAPGADGSTAALVVPITISINTAAFDATTGVPKFLNGPRLVSARANLAGSAPKATPSITLTFANPDAIIITASVANGSSANDASGILWRTGDLTATALAVIYSAASPTIQQIVLTAPACGLSAKTLTTAPYTATWAKATTIANGGSAACESGAMVVNANSTVNGAAGPGGASSPALKFDNKGPSAPTFVANPNGRQNGWINAAVGMAAQNSSTANAGLFPGVASATDNDWLLNGPTADGGVGGYVRRIRIGTGGGTIANANAATASATPTLPAPSVGNTTYCAVATAADLLGNESALLTGTTACQVPPIGTVSPTGTSHLQFGVDIAPPTVAYTLASLAADARVSGASIGGEYQVAVADTGIVGNSGMLAGSPVIANVIRREADGTSFTVAPSDCVVGTVVSSVCTQSTTGLAVALPLVNTTIAALAVAGYYPHTATALDAAGNSTVLAAPRTIVYDNTPATATNPSVPVTITGAFGAAAFLNDNLSIRDFYFTVGYGTALIAPTTITLTAAPTAVDAFNAATLTNTNFGINTNINTFLGLQATNAGNAPQAYAAGSNPMNGLNLFVRDQTQTTYSGPAFSPVAPTAPAAGVAITNAAPLWNFNTFTPASDNGTVCAGTLPAPNDCVTTAVPTTSLLSVNVVGTTATFPNPFSRVDFYGSNGTDLVLLTSVPAASATLVDNGAIRVYTYSTTLTQAQAVILLAGSGVAVVRNIYAFGVNAAGNVALVSQAVAQTINP